MMECYRLTNILESRCRPVANAALSTRTYLLNGIWKVS